MNATLNFIIVAGCIYIVIWVALFIIHYYPLAEGYEWIFQIFGITAALSVFGAVSFLLFWGIEYVLWYFLVRKK